MIEIKFILPIRQSPCMPNRITTFFMTSIFFLVNTPSRLEMINLACRYAQNRQIQLLSLSGTVLVKSAKIQLRQHKIAPFSVKFWVLFGNLVLQKWSRNVCLALQFSKLVLGGEIGQNLAKLWLFKVKKPCHVSYPNEEFWAGFHPFFT